MSEPEPLHFTVLVLTPRSEMDRRGGRQGMTTRRARASFAGLFMMLMLCVAFLLVPIMADCRGDATGCTADCGCALDSYPIDHSRPNCVFHSYNYCCESEGCAQYCRCTDDCNIICGQPVG